MTGLSIRRAKAGDEDLILTLLYELAEYEKLTHAFKLTKAVIARDFFAATPLAHCDLAYCEGEPVGLATWYWTYASFAAARGIYLEDLYVRAAMRGRGFGKALLALLAKEARDAGAVRVEWSVLNWNKPSIDFYEGIGAKPNTEWTIYRLDGNALAALAKS
jgi:diamine N-acetyltransferase